MVNLEVLSEVAVEEEEEEKEEVTEH